MDATFEQDTVQKILKLLGHGKLNGALVYIGARNLVKSEVYQETKFVEHDFIQFGCGLMFSPNFGGKKIKFVVGYDYGADLYKLLIVRVKGGAKGCEKISETEGIYVDSLAEIVESTYDELVKKECGGIPL